MIGIKSIRYKKTAIKRAKELAEEIYHVTRLLAYFKTRKKYLYSKLKKMYFDNDLNPFDFTYRDQNNTKDDVVVYHTDKVTEQNLDLEKLKELVSPEEYSKMITDFKKIIRMQGDASLLRKVIIRKSEKKEIVIEKYD